MTSDPKKRDFARRLAALSNGFNFEWGAGNMAADEVVRIVVTRADHNGAIGHLVSIQTGYSLSRLLRGLPWSLRRKDTGAIVRVGQTNKFGSFIVSGLEDGEYVLDIEGRMFVTTFVENTGQSERLSSPPTTADAMLTYGASAENGKRRIDGEWFSATISVEDKELTISFELDRTEIDVEDLLKCRMWNQSNELLTQFFVGLSTDSGSGLRRCYLPSHLRTKIDSELHLELSICPRDQLIASDIPLLEASIPLNDEAGKPSILRAIENLSK